MFDRRTDGRWWDIGLDLVTGCSPVSQGCAHCWSAERAHRAGHQQDPKIKARYGGLTDFQGNWTGEVRPQWQDLDKIGRAREPQAYTFWNDLFHPEVPDEFVDEVMKRIAGRLGHFYIICTKRPERALKFYSDPSRSWVGNAFQKSLMLMTTVENQEMAVRRLPLLLQIPGVSHGMSVEPGLGPVNFIQYTGARMGLDWIVCGGETGPHARPLHPDWVRNLRDQCQSAGVPFFFKSWGEWYPYPADYAGIEYVDESTGETKRVWYKGNGRFTKNIQWSMDGDVLFARVGKKTASRLLDGRTWDEVPG